MLAKTYSPRKNFLFYFIYNFKKIFTNSTRFSGGGGVNECLPAGMTKFIYINSIALNKGHSRKIIIPVTVNCDLLIVTVNNVF